MSTSISSWRPARCADKFAHGLVGLEAWAYYFADMGLTGQTLHVRLEPPRSIASDMLTVYGRYTG
jgi:hypothetical protein